MNMTFTIIAIAVVIVLGLSGYALYLFLQLRAREAERKLQQEQLEKELAERRIKYRESVRVICSALLADQVSLTEASIRISMLVSQLELTELEKPHYQVFFQLTEATSHIPILEEWNKLSKQEKLRYDLEREKLEESFSEFIKDAAQKLLDGSITAEGRALKEDGSRTEKQEPLFYSVGKE